MERVLLFVRLEDRVWVVYALAILDFPIAAVHVLPLVPRIPRIVDLAALHARLGTPATRERAALGPHKLRRRAGRSPPLRLQLQLQVDFPATLLSTIRLRH